MEKRQLVAGITGLPAQEVSNVVEFRRPASRLGENNTTHGRNHSEETEREIRLARPGKPLPEEHREKLLVGRLNRPFSEETRIKLMDAGRGKNNLAQFNEVLRRAWTTYFELPYGDARRELLALNYGFGIYRQHSGSQIGSTCGMSKRWVQVNLRRALTGQRLPGRIPYFRVSDESLKPLFRDVDQLDIRQLQRLADLLYRLDPQEVAMVFRLFGLGDQVPQSVAEINQQLFQSTPWGEKRIRDFRRTVETHIYSHNQPTNIANGPAQRTETHRVRPDPTQGLRDSPRPP